MKQFRISLLLLLTFNVVLFSCSDDTTTVTPTSTLVKEVTFGDVKVAKFTYDDAGRVLTMSLDKEFIENDKPEGKTFFDYDFEYIGDQNQLLTLVKKEAGATLDSIAIEYPDNKILAKVYQPVDGGKLAYSHKIEFNKNINGSIIDMIEFKTEGDSEIPGFVTSYEYNGGNLTRSVKDEVNGETYQLKKEYGFSTSVMSPFKVFNIIPYFVGKTVAISLNPIGSSVVTETGKPIVRKTYSYQYNTSTNYITSGEVKTTIGEEETTSEFTLTY